MVDILHIINTMVGETVMLPMMPLKTTPLPITFISADKKPSDEDLHLWLLWHYIHGPLLPETPDSLGKVLLVCKERLSNEDSKLDVYKYLYYNYREFRKKFAPYER